MNRGLSFIFLFLLAFILPWEGRAQRGGEPDFLFGDKGRKVLNVGALDHCEGMLNLPDGQVLLFGQTADFLGTFDLDALLILLNADGELDPSFGQNGVLRFDFPGQYNSRITDAHWTEDGIFIIGESNPNALLDSTFLFVGKLDAQGQAVSSFGHNGYFHETFGTPYTEAGGIAVDGNGKVIFCGTHIDTVGQHTEYPLVGRLTPEGQRDTTFGTTGLEIWSSLFGILDHESALTTIEEEAVGGRHSDGAQIIALTLIEERYFFMGYLYIGDYSVGFTMMLNDDGSLDQHYALGGTYVLDLNPGFSSRIVNAFAHDDTLFLSGYSLELSGRSWFHLKKMQQNGFFLEDRKLEFDGNHSVFEQGFFDGNQLYLSGTSLHYDNDPGPHSDFFALAALDTDLKPISGFGTAGTLLEAFPTYQESGATAIAARGVDKILSAGFVAVDDSINFTDIALFACSKAPFVPTNTKELQAERERQIFPNPVLSHLNISGGSGNYRLYDVAGRILKRGVYQGRISTSDLSPGSYFLESGDRILPFVKH